MQKKITALASLALVVAMLSGCAGETGGDGGATSDPDGAAGLQAAIDATEEAMLPPTSIPASEPLNEKPTPGETFVYMKCDQPDCIQQAAALQEAVEAIGWIYKDIPFQAADPATLVTAMKQALELDPIGVGVPTQPQAVWQGAYADYEAAGVPVVTSFVGPQEYDDVLIGQAGSNSYSEGEKLANWAIADSGGEAHVLLQTVPTFVLLESFVTGYQETMEKNCPKCSVTIVENTIPQLGGGQVPGTLIAALQKDPELNYIALTNSFFGAGLVPALESAGLAEQVKISSSSANATTLTDITEGIEQASTGINVPYSQWLMIDMLLRHLQGIPFEPAQGTESLPGQLLTKDTEFEISNTYDKPADWKELMKELWLVQE